MAFVLAQHGRGVALVDDQDAVEELPAEATDEAFGDRVGAWCPHRCPDDADVDGGEDGVEGGGELGVAVADQKPEAPTGIIEVHEQVAGLLGEPGSGGVGSDAKDVHPAGGVLDDEEAIQPVQRDGVEVEQVAGEDSARLGSQELWPRGSAPTRRRVDAGAVQDLPDGGGADLVAEADEFAVDASVAPSGVLGGQADDQSAHAGGHGGSTRSGRLGRPAAGEAELSNGFASAEDPAGLAICNRLGPATLDAFAERWFTMLPLIEHDRAVGCGSCRCARSRSPTRSCSAAGGLGPSFAGPDLPVSP